MKPITLLSIIFLAITLLSCNRSPSINHTTKKPDVPKPLQDDNKDFSLVSKSRGDNLVDAIYFDMVKKNPDLKKLEARMEQFNSGRLDSLKAFKEYDSKSDEYYYAAFANLDRIQDSVIKQRLHEILINSQKRYLEKVSKFTSIIKRMDDEQLNTANYYQTLRIAASLSVIEEYQNKGFPDSESADAIASQSSKLNSQTKKLAEKYQAKAQEKK
jgi:hypothetical protein